MTLPVSSHQNADQIQIELLRRAGPGKRLALARSLTTTVVSLARQAIRRRHPTAHEDEVLLEFVSVHYGPDLAARVRRYIEQ